MGAAWHQANPRGSVHTHRFSALPAPQFLSLPQFLFYWGVFSQILSDFMFSFQWTEPLRLLGIVCYLITQSWIQP